MLVKEGIRRQLIDQIPDDLQPPRHSSLKFTVTDFYRRTEHVSEWRHPQNAERTSHLAHIRKPADDVVALCHHSFFKLSPCGSRQPPRFVKNREIHFFKALSGCFLNRSVA